MRYDTHESLVAYTSPRFAVIFPSPIGPDDQGILTGRGATLGHRRLSIIDLESGSLAFMLCS